MIFHDFPRLRKHAPLFEAKIPSSWVAPELLELQLQRLVQWPCGKKNGNHVSFCWDTVSLSICEYMWIHVNVVISLFYWGFDISYQLETLGVFLGVAQFFSKKISGAPGVEKSHKIDRALRRLWRLAKTAMAKNPTRSAPICVSWRNRMENDGEWWILSSLERPKIVTWLSMSIGEVEGFKLPLIELSCRSIRCDFCLICCSTDIFFVVSIVYLLLPDSFELWWENPGSIPVLIPHGWSNSSMAAWKRWRSGGCLLLSMLQPGVENDADWKSPRVLEDHRGFVLGKSAINGHWSWCRLIPKNARICGRKNVSNYLRKSACDFDKFWYFWSFFRRKKV